MALVAGLDEGCIAKAILLLALMFTPFFNGRGVTLLWRLVVKDDFFTATRHSVVIYSEYRSTPVLEYSTC